MAKHGVQELLSKPAASDIATRRQQAKRLREALEELGPTFSKLGQVLSNRPDLLPAEYIEELAMLQSHVPPMSESEVVRVAEQELRVPWEDVFESIDPKPLAAGTIAQVHRATLENGDRVVVKVQRPGIREQVVRDFEALTELAQWLEAHPGVARVYYPGLMSHPQHDLACRQQAGGGAVEGEQHACAAAAHFIGLAGAAERTHAHAVPGRVVDGDRLHLRGHAEAVQKAAARLRKSGHYACRLSVGIKYLDGSCWDADLRLVDTQDTVTFLHALAKLWEGRPKDRRTILQVGMAFSDLVPEGVRVFGVARRRHDRARNVVDVGRAVDQSGGRAASSGGSTW